jgi:hypothetical protein
VDPVRHSTVASTTTHSRNTLMLMRSHKPYPRRRQIRLQTGSLENVNPPNARSTTMLAIE